MGLQDVNINTLSPHDFIYHASANGDIFGYQPVNSQFYKDKYECEEDLIRTIDCSYGRQISDLGPGFYLGNNKEESYAWGARFNNSIPVLNIFNTDYISTSNGRILDVFNNSDDLMIWVLSTSINRPLDDDARENFELLSNLYNFNLEQYNWIIAPRSDDSMWTFTHHFLKDDLTTEGLLTCTDQLSAGYQLVLKSQAEANNLVFVEYERYNVGDYPQLYSDGLHNEYYHCRDILGVDKYIPSVNPSAESISDILGIEKVILHDYY